VHEIRSWSVITVQLLILFLRSFSSQLQFTSAFQFPPTCPSCSLSLPGTGTFFSGRAARGSTHRKATCGFPFPARLALLFKVADPRIIRVLKMGPRRRPVPPPIGPGSSGLGLSANREDRKFSKMGPLWNVPHGRRPTEDFNRIGTLPAYGQRRSEAIR